MTIADTVREILMLPEGAVLRIDGVDEVGDVMNVAVTVKLPINVERINVSFSLPPERADG